MLPSALVELAPDEDVLVDAPPKSVISLSMNEEIIDCAELAVAVVLPEPLLPLELLVAPDSWLTKF